MVVVLFAIVVQGNDIHEHGRGMAVQALRKSITITLVFFFAVGVVAVAGW